MDNKLIKPSESSTVEFFGQAKIQLDDLQRYYKKDLKGTVELGIASLIALKELQEQHELSKLWEPQ